LTWPVAVNTVLALPRSLWYTHGDWWGWVVDTQTYDLPVAVSTYNWVWDAIHVSSYQLPNISVTVGVRL